MMDESLINHRMSQLGMGVICLGSSIAPLDFAVNIAFPAMTKAFALGTQEIRWVAICYMLTYGGLMLLFGSIGDRIGHLKVFRVGLMLGLIAFLLCACSPTFAVLLIGRVLQGIAIALTLSCAPALVLKLFPDYQRTWALSMYGAYFALAAAFAPVIGGVVTQLLGWPGVYWFRIPIVLLAWVCLRFVQFPPVKNLRTYSTRADYAAWRVLAQVVHHNPNFVWINISSIIVQWTVFAIPLMVPYYLIQMAGWTSSQCGLILGVWASGTVAGSFLAQKITTKFSFNRAAYISGWVGTIGLASIALWSTHVSILSMVASLLVCGFGLGVYQVAYADMVVLALPKTSRGVAGSLTQVTRTLGVIAGAFVWLWVFEFVTDQSEVVRSLPSQAFVSGYRAMFLAAAGLSAAYLILTSFKSGLWFDRSEQVS